VLTPIGNPPLLAGLLRGVPLLWPARNLIGIWLLAVGLLLAVFFLTDWWLARREPPAPPPNGSQYEGGERAAGAAAGASVTIPVSPVPFGVVAGGLSLWFTPRGAQANDFSWHR